VVTQILKTFVLEVFEGVWCQFKCISTWVIMATSRLVMQAVDSSEDKTISTRIKFVQLPQRESKRKTVGKVLLTLEILLLKMSMRALMGDRNTLLEMI
jgi:hypothetical protein